VVVGQALALLDEVGLARFTMRALADRLGTYPATIYWHVGNRGELLSQVAAVVLDEVFSGLPDPEVTSWDQWLIETARSYRRAMHRHPAMAVWAVTHFEAQVPVPRQLEQIVQVLGSAGFDGPALVGAYNAYLGTLVGWVGMELIPDDPDLGSDPQRMEASVRGLPTDVAPTIVGNLDHFANAAFGFRWQGGAANPLDDGFECTVRALVDGLRHQLDEG